jgi:putative ABC transport system ATP-binding protein
MSTDLAPALEAIGVTRVFGSGDAAVTACDTVSLAVHAGELLVIRGRSGSGKTTLLDILGTLARPTSGRVMLDGHLDLAAASEAQLVEIRRSRLGFVFQHSALIPVLSAAENVEVPLRLAGTPTRAREARVAELLDAVGLADHANQRPGELSGGQQQRVGIARALACDPSILLADEPTGQLDSTTSAAIMDLFSSLVRERNVAAILTTHDPILVARADRVVEMHDGRIRAPRHSA